MLLLVLDFVRLPCYIQTIERCSAKVMLYSSVGVM